MRKSVETSNVFHLPRRPESFARRPLAPIPGLLICLVLVRHGESEKALLVSDSGDSSKAVWVPKSMLIIEPNLDATYIVATLPKTVADQKRLSPYAVMDRSWLNPDQIASLDIAQSLAARNRNRLRRHRSPLPYPGRNMFA